MIAKHHNQPELYLPISSVLSQAENGRWYLHRRMMRAKELESVVQEGIVRTKNEMQLVSMYCASEGESGYIDMGSSVRYDLEKYVIEGTLIWDEKDGMWLPAPGGYITFIAEPANVKIIRHHSYLREVGDHNLRAADEFSVIWRNAAHGSLVFFKAERVGLPTVTKVVYNSYTVPNTFSLPNTMRLGLGLRVHGDWSQKRRQTFAMSLTQKVLDAMTDFLDFSGVQVGVSTPCNSKLTTFRFSEVQGHAGEIFSKILTDDIEMDEEGKWSFVEDPFLVVKVHTDHPGDVFVSIKEAADDDKLGKMYNKILAMRFVDIMVEKIAVMADQDTVKGDWVPIREDEQMVKDICLLQKAADELDLHYNIAFKVAEWCYSTDGYMKQWKEWKKVECPNTTTKATTDEVEEELLGSTTLAKLEAGIQE